jgi:Fe2+ or Zn2+ uptake regulation protein
MQEQEEFNLAPVRKQELQQSARKKNPTLSVGQTIYRLLDFFKSTSLEELQKVKCFKNGRFH